MSETTFNLSTLNLAAGTYSITVKAEAEGYTDSDRSNEVTYTVKEAIPTDCIVFIGDTYVGLGLGVGTDLGKYWDGVVEYSTDKNTWNTWDGSDISSDNKKLYLRGKNNSRFTTDKSKTSRNITNISVDGTNIRCYGNINTLLDYENPPTVLAEYCFEGLFQYNYSLILAPTLPATTLARGCYNGMFSNCTSLTTAPDLPATTLAGGCYNGMFRNCTSLTTAPELPATTLANYCYQNMFQGCTSLTTAPALPATTLASGCYSRMFSNCTSLTSAPELPATTLGEDCYQEMFSGCTSLTTAPALPATTLAKECYSAMFMNCTPLTSAPELPATTLANYCYQEMFLGCTSLTTAPALPATTLANGCYGYMFSKCTGLKISATQTEEYTTAWRIPVSGTITTAPFHWNDSMLNRTGGTFTGNPSINTTYYIAG